MFKKAQIKIITHKISAEEREHLCKLYLHIKQLSKQSKEIKDKDLRDVIKNEIQRLRDSYLYEWCFENYQITLKMGKFEKKQAFVNFIDQSGCKLGQNVKNMYEDFKASFNNLRVEKYKKKYGKHYQSILQSKFEMRRTTKDFHSIDYTTVGRTFTEPNTILKFQQDEKLQHRRLRKAKVPYTKDHYVGVELELFTKIGRDELNTLMAKEKLGGFVYVKGDGSIRTEADRGQAHEVTVIGKEQDIVNIITRVCKVLNSKECDAAVNNSCGLHVHLDMRSRDPEICYSNLYAALPVLAAMVPKTRTEGDEGRRYCMLNNTAAMPKDGGRYKAINDQAYQSHKTLEVRLHSGSTNAAKINNWIKILMNVVNKKTRMSEAETFALSLGKQVGSARELCAVFGLGDEIETYIVKRIEKFKDSKVDTRKDHFDEAI